MLSIHIQQGMQNIWSIHTATSPKGSTQLAMHNMKGTNRRYNSLA